MDVTCPACAARYTADDEKLRGKTARMRCPTCAHVWLVSGPPAEKTAARVKRNEDREKRDMFASRPLDEGYVKQTLHPPPPVSDDADRSGAVAARNESSLLFTVDSIKGNAIVKTPEPAPASIAAAPPATADDSGIIDLKALSTRPPAALGAVVNPVAPLFSDAPAAFSVDAPQPKPEGGIPRHFKIIGGIAAAAAFLLVSGLGLSLAFRGEEPVARNALTAPLPQPAQAAAAITPPAAPEPAPAAAAPAAAAAADDSASAPEPGKKKKKKGKGAKHSPNPNMSAPDKAEKASAPAAKPSKPAGDSCGCKGDFNCILRCTAKGK